MSSVTSRVRFRDALRTLLEDDARTNTLIASALRAAGRDALPEEPTELLEFVQWYVVDELAEEIGPALARTLVAELEADLHARAPTGLTPRPPERVARGTDGFSDRHRARVALWCRETSAREELRELLVGAGFGVDLRDAGASSSNADAVLIVVHDIVDVARLESIVKAAPSVIVAITHDHARTVANAMRPVALAEPFPASTPPRVVISALQKLIVRLGRSPTGGEPR